MSLKVLGSASCTKSCANCARNQQRRRESCDPHAPCPGYGTTLTCPPLIVIAVHEAFHSALPQIARNAHA